MTITILSENGRGRHLCQWAIAQGFQVNMVLPENDAYLEFPFGEFILDENTDWAQDYADEAIAVEKNKTLFLMNVAGTKTLPANYAKSISASWFDLDKVVQSSELKAAPWWTRQWSQEDWQRQIQKLKNQGVNFDFVDPQFYGITFDFRNNFLQRPLWQWGSFKINWDPGIYADVVPSAFIWLKNQEEYLAYENFAFVQKVKNHQWEVFVKLPYSRLAEVYTDNFVTLMQAWIKNFSERLQWAKVEAVGEYKVFPFYQWKSQEKKLKKIEKDPYFYDKGPHTFGSWSFKDQWQCEKVIFDVLTNSQEMKTQRKSQRKKNPYDFQILEA